MRSEYCRGEERSGEFCMRTGEIVELARLYIRSCLPVAQQLLRLCRGVVGLDSFLPAPEELWRSSLSVSPDDPINKQRYGGFCVDGKSVS